MLGKWVNLKFLTYLKDRLIWTLGSVEGAFLADV